MGFRRFLSTLLLLALLALGGAALFVATRAAPQDTPWAPLDLADPAGLFTGRKLAALTATPGSCRALLDRAGVAFTPLPARGDRQCGYGDAVRPLATGAATIRYRPAGLGVACPVAAALALWEWDVVQPAAIVLYGERVTAIEHFGSYSCRRLYGREAGAWSEHARANAIDVAGFRLESGRRIRVVAAWRGDDRDARFLHRVRDGACDLFATVLSPDYNAAHRDHLHLDQAARGARGWRACR